MLQYQKEEFSSDLDIMSQDYEEPASSLVEYEKIEDEPDPQPEAFSYTGFSEERKQEIEGQFVSMMAKNSPIYYRFHKYVNGLPDDERETWLDLIEEQAISGNKSKEAMFILDHSAPFAVAEMYEMMEVMIQMSAEDFKIRMQQIMAPVEKFIVRFMKDIVVISDTVDEISAKMESQLEFYEQAIDSLTQTAILEHKTTLEKGKQELESIGARVEAQAQAKRVDADISHKQQMDKEAVQLRNKVVDIFRNEIRDEAQKAFAKSRKEIGWVDCLKVGVSVVIGMTVFTIISKLI